MRTYSHDALRAIFGERDDETLPCDRCRRNLLDHVWITLTDNGYVVKCSNQNRLTGSGTGV